MSLIQIEQPIKNGSMIGIEGSSLCGKTTLALNLIPHDSKSLFIDLFGLDSFVFKNCNRDLDILNAPNIVDINKIIKSSEYDYIILDTFTNFNYSPRIIKFILERCIDEALNNNKTFIVVFDNMSDYDNLLFKSYIALFNFYVYCFKHPVVNFNINNEIRSFLRVDARTIKRLFETEKNFSFLIDCSNGMINESEFFINKKISNGEIIKRGKFYYYKDNRYESFGDIFKHIEDELYLKSSQ